MTDKNNTHSDIDGNELTLSRRHFALMSLLGLGAAACTGAGDTPAVAQNGSAEPTGGSDDITSKIKAAEDLFDVEFTAAEREQMKASFEAPNAALKALRDFEKPNSLAPAMAFDPRVQGVEYKVQTDRVTTSKGAKKLPSSDVDIAYSSVIDQAGWIKSGALTSERLTQIYLARIEKYNPQLECFITVTKSLALSEARRADGQIAAGNYKGLLHGIPYGAKDLLDTAGIKTTYGAEPFKDRVANSDATLITKLRDAGAVLLGKTSLGALAYGDIWFGGVTKNPWNTKEGSSGSSAGSCSSVAAGLCSFALGTETLGSIISPSTRCGTAGLRPTFGRVSKAGAMALCWSMDKIGPIIRSAEDAAAVMEVINGYDVQDPSSQKMGFNYNSGKNLSDLTLGYDPAWFENADEGQKAALEAAKASGIKTKQVSNLLPDLPYGALSNILLAEAAAAFEMLTLDGRDDNLRWQEDNAWPNSFRAARFITAIDLVQTDRIRRLAMEAMHKAFEDVDILISPPFAGGLLQVTNYTGHPAMVLRSGFSDQPARTLFGNEQTDPESAAANVPNSVVLWGPLFEDAHLINLSKAIEARLGEAVKRPSGFAA